MPTTLTNMGLTSWTSGSDLFNHSQLAANWSAVDTHDHTTGKGVQVPSGGIVNGAVTNGKLAADAVDASKILDGSVGTAELAVNAVTTVKVADANITTTKILDGAVTTAKIAGASILSSLLKPTMDTVTATGSLTNATTLTDVPGTSITITPTFNAYAFVWAFFHMETQGTAPAGLGVLVVNGVVQTGQIQFYAPAGQRSIVGRSFKVPMTASTAYTIKLQAGTVSSGQLNVFNPSTGYTYMLIAQ